MPEALICVAVLIIGVLIGAFIKPDEAQLRPLSPDQIKGPDGGHAASQAEASAHHH